MPTLDFTVTKHPMLSLGNAPASHGKYTGPASYVTGGDILSALNLKLGSITGAFFSLARNVGGTIYGLDYDAGTGKIIWYVLDTGSEVANGTDLSGYSARFFAIGT